MTEPLRLAVLLSGSGTTLQNLIDRIQHGRLQARIVRVISSNPAAFGLTRARNAGLPTEVVDRKNCAGREDFSRRIFDQVRAASAELVCLAGFLQLLPIPPDFENRVLNIHPALIPAFSGKGFHGLGVHQAAIEAGVKISGCTVHFADNQYDHGPIVLQRAVAVADEDTPESLQARIFAQECDVYPEAIELFAAARLCVAGRRVRILPARPEGIK